MEGASNPMPQDDEVDNFIVIIDREIKSIPPNHLEACIFKVNDLLRQGNPKSYEPEILAIGPYNYHHGKKKLKAMQEHKLRYLQLLRQRRDELSVDRYITAMRNMEEQARRCYGSPVDLERDDFVKMMFLDGCFIIELFGKNYFTNLIDKDDPIFKMGWIRSTLARDLMLFENQLPFFVLVELFKMTKDFSCDDNKIIHVAQDFLSPLMPDPFEIKDPSTISQVDHLLGLMHDCWCSSFAKIVPNRNAGNAGEKLEFIKSVVELEEAGIEFKKREEYSSLLSIKFEKGVMEILPLRI